MLRDWFDLFRAHRQSREDWVPAEGLLGRDRRVFQRIPCRIVCQLASEVFEMKCEGTTVNLSMGGLQLSLPVVWPEGSPVQVKLSSLGFSAEGVIAYRSGTASPCQYGIKFQRMGIQSLIKLRRIMRENYKGPLGA